MKNDYKEYYKNVFISRKEIKEIMNIQFEPKITKIMDICREEAKKNNRIEPRKGYVYREYFNKLIGLN
ncbi:hypothetical protein [Caviibacter abscessus]|uniref:hypothetical protein n=1 Tax=Caviibacter abscessus TaxID=1766719 RepID=UPI0008388127|nr:hypothetical protein [Caviibacter abscessus]